MKHSVAHYRKKKGTKRPCRMYMLPEVELHPAYRYRVPFDVQEFEIVHSLAEFYNGCDRLSAPCQPKHVARAAKRNVTSIIVPIGR